MKKHAASHGLAVLVCTVTSGVLVKIGRDHYPAAAGKLESVGAFVVENLNLEYSAKAVSTLLLASLLAVVWGVFFYFLHSDKKKFGRD